MALTWQRWEALKSSLDYCCVRIGELSHSCEDDEEFEEVVQHGIATAGALLHLPDAPPLSTAIFRKQWEIGCSAVSRARDRIAAADFARREALNAATGEC